MLKFRHLKTLTALREHGSLAAASEELNLTPSALSHQLKEIENYYDATLVDRSSRPLTFTPAGRLALELADRVLPEVIRTRTAIRRLSHGQAGRLRLASECHSCFDWLMPILNQYRKSFPDVELDFATGFEPEPHIEVAEGDIDLLITSSQVKHKGLSYTPLFEYESRLVVAPTHDLAKKPYIDAQDLVDCTLITYPVDVGRLDVFTHFLNPKKIKPAKLRTTELTAMLIQLVASEQGVAALPDWVVSEYENKGWVVSKPMGTGVSCQLFAAFRTADKEKIFMASFLEILEKMIKPR